MLVGALSPGVRALAEVVMGGPIAADQIEELTPETDAGEPRTWHLLRARELGLIGCAHHRGQLRIASRFLADAFLAEASAARVAGLHEARLRQQVAGLQSDPFVVLRLAQRVGDDDRIIDIAPKAAESAFRRGQRPRALGALRLRLAALDRKLETHARGSHARRRLLAARLAAREQLASALLESTLGEARLEAAALLRELTAQHSRRRQPLDTARARARLGRAELQLGRAREAQIVLLDALGDLQALARQASPKGDANVTALLVEVESALGRAHLGLGQLAAGRRHLASALAAATKEGLFHDAIEARLALVEATEADSLGSRAEAEASARALLERALEDVGRLDPQSREERSSRARVEFALARLAARQGSEREAATRFRAALEYAVGQDQGRLCRQVRLELGRLALARGDLLQAETELSAAARACRRAADHELLEEGLADLAEVRLARGEFNEACVTLDELATLSHVRGDPAIYATALIELAVAFRRAGQPRFAGACDERAVEVARATRRDDLIADARLGEAETARLLDAARLLDELERAEPLFAEAYEAAEAAGSPGSAVLASLGRADLAMSRGEPAAARARLAEAEGALADAREVETNQRRPGAAIESLGGRPRASFQALEAMVRALRSRLMAATGELGEARRLARSLPPARAASMICAPRDVARDRTLALLLAGEPEAAREAALELSEPWRSAFGGRARLASLRSASARSRGWGGSRNLGPEIAKQARAMLERALHDAGRRGLLGLARRVGLGLAEAAALGGDLRLASTLLDEVSRGSPIDRRFHAQVGLARLSVQRTAGELAAACRTLTEVDRLLPGLHDPALEVQLALEGARVLRLHGEVAAARARILLGEERLAQLQATFEGDKAPGESAGARGGEVGAWMRRAEERLAAERRALEDGSGFVGGASSNEGAAVKAPPGAAPPDTSVTATEVRLGPDRRL
ncbi:MAG: hypothetical protein ACYTFT_17115, partial [Planctomycetota bacterium]